MKSFYILCCFSFVFGMLSCKQDAATQQSAETPAVTGDTANAAGQQAPGQPASNQEALKPATQGHDYTFLTDKILIYKAAFGGEKNAKEQPFKDEWIDLQPDGTYKAGKLKQQTHTGEWSYNHDTQTLYLGPTTTGFKRSEWKVMHNEQMMVWVGTQTYADNSIQIKLERSETLPE